MATTYTYKETGDGGYLRIADDGRTVTFAIRSGNSSTFDNDLYWAYDVNGSGSTTVRGSYNSGGAYKDLRSFTVTSSQTVWFSIQATGTSGLGGPTVHNRYISRASKPDAPTKPTTNVISNTVIDADINDGDDNGASITSRQIGIREAGSSPSYSWYTASSSGYRRFTGLDPDTVYYFQGRTSNSEGTSNGSYVSEGARTFSRPDAPYPPRVSAIGDDRATVTFTDGSNNGGSITGRQIGWSTTSTIAGGTIVSSDGSTVVTGLPAGDRINFWARTTNAYGTGPWSAATTITTEDHPAAPARPVLTEITQDSMMVKFTDGANGGASITNRRIAYNTSNTLTGATIVSSDGSTVLTGLPPGDTVYVWASTYNEHGWGPWSAVNSGTTIAGMFVMYLGQPKPAVPYVNVGGVAATESTPAIPGVWKIAEPQTRFYGLWKKPW